MREVNIPVGTSDFAEIRREGYYYIDKSGLIEELLRARSTKVTLITRPRPFGKTLGMSMLSEFFDIEKDSREAFSGLSVEKNEELCREWQNQYPTLSLSFKSVEGLDFSGAYARFVAVIAEFFAGIFAGAGCEVESNREHGERRSDMVVKDYGGDRAAVFEVKYARSREGLLKACGEAVAQIDHRMYGEELREDYSQVISYGIAFYKKRCLIKRKLDGQY